MTDTLVVTGGEDTWNTVVRYGQEGWLEDLPDLITGRYLHACSSFVSSGRVVSKYQGQRGGIIIRISNVKFRIFISNICNLALKISCHCSIKMSRCS